MFTGACANAGGGSHAAISHHGSPASWSWASAAAGAAHAQQSLRGADALAVVVTDVIAACPGAVGNIVYVGGANGAGQAAIDRDGANQHVNWTFGSQPCDLKRNS